MEYAYISMTYAEVDTVFTVASSRTIQANLLHNLRATQTSTPCNAYARADHRPLKCHDDYLRFHLIPAVWE